VVTKRKPTDERRTEIADAALRLIGARGLASLTVASLAAELGMTGGALYRHFASTDEILTAVASRAAALIDEATPLPGPSARAWLRALAERRTAAVGGHAGLSRLLLSDQLALGLPAPAVEVLARAVVRTRESIVAAIEFGQAQGELRGDLPAAVLAPLVMGAVQMVALQRAGSLLPRTKGDPMMLFDAMLVLLSARPRDAAKEAADDATDASRESGRDPSATGLGEGAQARASGRSGGARGRRRSP
jgi:AcrR family transcriptional regulator